MPRIETIVAPPLLGPPPVGLESVTRSKAGRERCDIGRGAHALHVHLGLAEGDDAHRNLGDRLSAFGATDDDLLDRIFLRGRFRRRCGCRLCEGGLCPDREQRCAGGTQPDGILLHQPPPNPGRLLPDVAG